MKELRQISFLPSGHKLGRHCGGEWRESEPGDADTGLCVQHLAPCSPVTLASISLCVLGAVGDAPAVVTCILQLPMEDEVSTLVLL